MMIKLLGVKGNEGFSVDTEFWLQFEKWQKATFYHMGVLSLSPPQYLETLVSNLPHIILLGLCRFEKTHTALSSS